MRTRDLQTISRFAGGTRKKGEKLYGILGDFSGTVLVPDSDEVLYYVRVNRSGGYELGEYKSRIPLSLALNAPVELGQDPLTNEWVIVAIDEVMLAASDYTGPALNVGAHQESHNWGGGDQLNFIHVLQMFWPARVQITGANTVLIQAGVVRKRSTGYSYTAQESIDLSTYYPASGQLYVLIYITHNGDITVGDNSATTLESLMHPPTGAWAIAAIRLRAGVSLQWEDVVDLRMMGLSEATSVLGLLDTPSSYGTIGQMLVVNEDRDGLRWASGNEGLGGYSIVDHGTVTVNLTNTFSVTPGGQYVTATVTLSAAQDDTDYQVEFTVEDSPVMVAVTTKTTTTFTILVAGITDTGTLSPKINWKVIRWTT